MNLKKKSNEKMQKFTRKNVELLFVLVFVVGVDRTL